MSTPEKRHAQAPQQTNYEHDPSSDANSVNEAGRAFFDAQTPQDLSGFNYDANSEFIEHPQAGQPRTDGFGNNPQTVHYSEYRPLHEKKPLIRTRTIVLGALAVSTAIGVWAGYNKLNEAKQVMDLYGALNNTPATAAATNESTSAEGTYGNSGYLGLEGDLNGNGTYEKDELASMSSSTFKDLDTFIRLDYIQPEIDYYSDETWRILSKYLDDKQRAVLYQPKAADKADYSSQDILNSYALNMYQASIQGTDSENGRKIMSVVVDPEFNYYNEVASRVGDSTSGFSEITEVVREYPRIDGGEFMGHHFIPNGGQLIEIKNVDTGTNSVFLFSLQQTSPQNQAWILVDNFNRNNSSLQNEIQEVLGSK